MAQAFGPRDYAYCRHIEDLYVKESLRYQMAPYQFDIGDNRILCLCDDCAFNIASRFFWGEIKETVKRSLKTPLKVTLTR